MQIGVDSARAVDNRRVLVVEPDEVIRTALQFMLMDEHETHAVADLESLSAQGTPGRLDLIVLGAGLVRVHGTAVIRMLWARFDGVAVLLVGDIDDEALLQAGLQSGAQAVLRKPLAVESVRRAVSALLPASGAPRGAAQAKPPR